MTDVELIKSKIDIVDFIGEYVSLKKAGRNFKAPCPFHSEKTPSFIVSPERGSWYCFGACSEGGDVISFLQKWENIEFIEVLKILAQKTGVALSGYTPTDAYKLKEKLYDINHLASEFYHYLLASHRIGERARRYLKERGIRQESIKTFTLGYAPESWEALFRFLTKKGYRLDDVYTSGLLVKSQGGSFYDRFRGRLIFTLKDPRGKIVGFAGRKLAVASSDGPTGGSITEDKEAKYVNTSETPIYKKGETLYGMDVTREAIRKANEAIVVEGEIDMISSFQAGVTNVVAIKGSALTEGQILLLKRYTENLTLALDSDFAGNEAARRGIELADSAGLSVRVVELVSGKDPADCIKEGAHLWKKSIQNAVPVYEFIIDTAIKKYNKNDVFGKKKIGFEVVPFLAKLQNPIVQSHFIKRLAGELNVTEESIQTSIAQFQKKGRIEETTKAPIVNIKRDELLEEYLLTLIIQSDDVFDSLSRVNEILSPIDFKIPPIKNIFEKLLFYFKTQKKFKVKDFSSFLSPETFPTFDKAIMIDIENILSQKKIYKRELVKTIKEVKKLSLRRSINLLSTQILQAQKEERADEERILQEKLRGNLSQLTEVEKLTGES